ESFKAKVSLMGFPRIVNLPDGKKITVEHKPERIISLSIGTDEILCALIDQNSLNRVVALSRYSTAPEMSNIAEIAGRVGVLVERDAEQIVSLKPDLVLAARYTKAELRQIIDQTHVPMVVVSDFHTIAEISGNIRLIGHAIGEDTRADEIIDAMQVKLRNARERLKPERTSLRVLYLAPGNWTAGAATNVHEIITMAGLHNVAAEAGITGHSKIAVENILEIDPDLILVATGHERDRDFVNQLVNDTQLVALTAVKKGQIIKLPSRYLRTVSHHLADGVSALVDAVNTLNGGRALYEQ
ncbi:MAG: ABC transporter substrate-binding protein, partial [Acidobacteriota bacterium]